MKITVFLIFVLFGFGFTNARAQKKTDFDLATLSEAGKVAYQKLFSAGIFRIGGVGYSGSTSEEEKALEVLLSEKDAIDALKSLVKEATAEGGLYGLAGLYVKDLQLFKVESDTFKKRELPVNRKVASLYGNYKVPEGFVVTQSGCMVSNENATTIIANIEAGKYDFDLNRYAGKKVKFY